MTYTEQKNFQKAECLLIFRDGSQRSIKPATLEDIDRAINAGYVRHVRKNLYIEVSLLPDGEAPPRQRSDWKPEEIAAHAARYETKVMQPGFADLTPQKRTRGRPRKVQP